MAGQFVNQLQPGMKVGKYQVVALLAAGGMSMVYKAYDKTLDRYVAIKQIAPNLAADEKFVDRFRREAQVLARLSQGQQNVVSVYELIEEGGGLFMIMEFVEGSPLQKAMDKGAIPLQTGMGILLKIALGLRAIHAQGIVHRDLKPDNIMVQPSGNVKIADFGLVGRSGGRTSLPMGTTQYMAPEMFAGGPIDSRADIYSLGFMAYQMFIGPEKFREVFADITADPQSAHIRWMHWHSNPHLKAPDLKVAQPGIPPLVARIVERMMEKDPARRFNSADQIIKWLRQIVLMNVQGKSLSEQDSAKLEDEVDAEVGISAGGARVPARTAAAASVAAGGAGGSQVSPVKPVGGAVAEVSSSAKTAPLPKRRWGWQEYARYGAIAAAVLVVAVVALAIVKSSKVQNREAAARHRLELADKSFKDRQFADVSDARGDLVATGAIAQYNALFRDYADLPQIKGPAEFWSLVSQAELSLQNKKWDQANAYIKQAKEVALKWRDPNALKDRAKSLAQEFVDRVVAQRRYDQLSTLAGEAERAENYDDAMSSYEQMQSEGVIAADEAAAAIKRLEGLRSQAQSRKLMTEGDALLTQKKFKESRQKYVEAQALLDTKEIQDRLERQRRVEEYGKIVAAAELSAKDKKWTAAHESYLKAELLAAGFDQEAKVLADVEMVARKAKEAKAQNLFAEGQALEAQGKPDEAGDKYAEAATLDPSSTVIRDKMRAMSGQKEYDRFHQAYRKAKNAGKFEEAIDNLQRCINLQFDPAEKERLVKELSDYRQKYLVRMADEARRARDWPKAQELYEEAERVGPPDREISYRLDSMKDEKIFFDFVDKGKAAAAQGDFDEAIRFFTQADQKLGKAHPEAKEMIKDAKYQKYMKLAVDACDKHEYGTASGYVELARQERGETPEYKALYKKIKDAQGG